MLIIWKRKKAYQNRNKTLTIRFTLFLTRITGRNQYWVLPASILTAGVTVKYSLAIHAFDSLKYLILGAVAITCEHYPLLGYVDASVSRYLVG